MPGVHLSGNVTIGEGVLLGTGAVVLPGVKIGAWSKIGAGAVVTKDVKPGSVMVGTPARCIKMIKYAE
jgi:acetyltransferase EpsM